MSESEIIQYINKLITGKLTQYQNIEIRFYKISIQINVLEYDRFRPDRLFIFKKGFVYVFNDPDRTKNIESLINWLKE